MSLEYEPTSEPLHIYVKKIENPGASRHLQGYLVHQKQPYPP